MGPRDLSRDIIPRGVEKISRSPLCQDQPVLPIPQERHDSFIESLGPEEREAWERYIQTRNDTSPLKRFLASIRESREGEDSDPPQQYTEEDAIGAEHDLRQVLSGEGLKEFESFVLPYLNGDIVDNPGFDVSVARRWIPTRVFELGWSAEQFGFCGYHSSHTSKPERMVKKYQWIAYHELLARLTDNFVFEGNYLAGMSEPYFGQ
jgi:hypothetical protein